MNLDSVRDVLTILLSASFVLTGYRALRYHRYILAASCACLLFIPLNRYGVVPRSVALVFTNIGAFGLMYKINWFLHHYDAFKRELDKRDDSADLQNPKHDA